jgi:hypothetical protein
MRSSTSSSEPLRGVCAIVLATAGAVFLILAGASEALLRNVVAPQDTFAPHAALFNGPPATDVIFGDSHAARGAVPPPGMLNLAYPSENVSQMAWKAKSYFANHTPGRVIVQADPHLFARYRVRVGLAGYPARFAAPERAPFGLLVLAPRYRAELPAYWRAYIAGGGHLQSKVKRLENGALLSNGDLSRVIAHARRHAASARAEEHRIVHDSETVAEMQRYAAMLDLLRYRGAQLCLVSYPVSPDYLAALDRAPPEARRAEAETRAFFAAEARRLSARYVDHARLITARDAFRDVDHLNGAAARGYGPRLIAACFDGGDGLRARLS